MRTKAGILLLLSIAFFNEAFGSVKPSPLPDTIFVNTSQTILVVFSVEVAKVDIGSKDFGGQIDGNTVLLKVAKENVNPTSLYIRYGNDFLQATLAYSATKWKPMVDLRKASEVKKEEVKEEVKGPSLDQQMIDRRIGFVEAAKDRIKQNGIMPDKILFALKEIIQDENNYYIKFLMINSSKTKYQIEFFEFTYKTPTENGVGDDLFPATITGSNSVTEVNTKEQKYIVFAISKYALTKKGKLAIVCREKNGGRRLELHASYKELTEIKSF